jgi:transcriptional regulator with XRE-family HTH domain
MRPAKLKTRTKRERGRYVSFGSQFADIRRRRRIPLRLFNDLAGVSPSYIHDIEQGGVLPSLEKLQAITSVLRAVAAEQGAADPDAETSELFRSREETIYIERMHVHPSLARVFVALRELDDDSIENIEELLIYASSLFGELEKPVQRGAGRALTNAISVINKLKHSDRDEIGMIIAKHIGDAVDTYRPKTDPDNVDPPRSTTMPPTTAAGSKRERQRASQ